MSRNIFSMSPLPMLSSQDIPKLSYTTFRCIQGSALGWEEELHEELNCTQVTSATGWHS